ncbi:pyridoxamine 5'-phosphate oxidase family protein [Nocardioides immobilis]|uniref:Pyridoxamine 5'-phosphate oxidase family protein n=2 Tax=Nocardioides immobilis TaxID=2049295 RepID=A0A417Y8P3_9ACTN|nr:pyridoxamine 5'-phosphate oxidase family protein [Nocardioides immobilis]
MRVASLNKDGSIYLSPIWYAVTGERLIMVVDSSRHGDNFKAGRAFSAVVDQGDDYRSLSGLTIVGEAKEVTDPAIVSVMPDLLFEKYFYVGHPHAESYFEFGEWSGRRYFELVPTKMVGWDSRENTHAQGRERHTFPRQLASRLYERGGERG